MFQITLPSGSECSGLGPITDVMAFVRMCTGQPFIDGREGVILEVDLSKLTEPQLNGLFAAVVEMKICITIKGSSVKRIVFPKLTKWTTCALGENIISFLPINGSTKKLFLFTELHFVMFSKRMGQNFFVGSNIWTYMNKSDFGWFRGQKK